MTWFTVLKATDAWLVSEVKYGDVIGEDARIDESKPLKQIFYVHRDDLGSFIYGDEKGEWNSIRNYLEQETGYQVISFTHKQAGIGGHDLSN